MAVLKITHLGGLEPSILPRNLSDGGAQVAVNLNPGSTEFRPLLADKEVAAADYVSPLSLYRFDRNADGSVNTDETTGWKCSPVPLHIARQQLNDDTTGKIYYVPADGSVPMRWHNAAGVDRQAGVPAPVTAPSIDSVNEGYVFTQDVRTFELTAALDQAVRIVMANTRASWVGPDASLPQGWVRTTDFLDVSDPRYDGVRGEVIRVFAVDPVTGGVVNTFTDMPADESAWVFDQTLGGSYYSPNGAALPVWAMGYARFWIIGMRAFALAYDLDTAAIKAALLMLKMPGTQGSEPLLTNAEADAMVARLVEHGDKDGLRVGAKIAALRAKVWEVAAAFTSGGRASLDAQTRAFYQRSDVQTTLTNARYDFAQAIWGYVRMIGSATAPPYWTSSGD